MRFGIGCPCNINGDADGNLAGLDGAKQPMLAILQQSKNGFDIFDGEAGFSSDGGVVIAPLLQALDVMQQVDRAMLPAGEILHQAHHHAIFGVGLDDDGRNLVLAERLISFQPALAANKGVSGAVCIVSTRDRDRPLQANSAMFDTISLNIFLLRTRGLITVMRSMGMSSIV